MATWTPEVLLIHPVRGHSTPATERDVLWALVADLRPVSPL